MTDSERGFRAGLTDGAIPSHATREFLVAYRAGRRAVFVQTVQGMANRDGMPSGAALFNDGTFASCNG